MVLGATIPSLGLGRWSNHESQDFGSSQNAGKLSVRSTLTWRWAKSATATRPGVPLRLSVNETVRTLVGLYLPSALVSIGQGMLAPITPALAGAFDVPLGLAAQV